MKREKENRRRVASCEPQSTGCRLQVTGCRLQAASCGLRAASGQENLFVALCETSVSSVVKKELNTERRAASCKLQAASGNFFTTESTKKTQRKATSCKLQASSFEPRVESQGLRAVSGQENLFVNLCETSVSSPDCTPGQVVVKKELNTENTKKTQRNTEKNIEMKNFVALCGTSVSSPDCTSGQVVVEENLNTERKAASRELQAESCEPREKNSLRLCASAVNNSSTTPGIRIQKLEARSSQPEAFFFQNLAACSLKLAAIFFQNLAACSLKLAAKIKYSPAVLHSFTANSGALYGIFINDCPGTAAITYFFTPQSSSRGTLKFNHHPCNNSHCLISPTAGRTGSGLIWRNAMA